MTTLKTSSFSSLPWDLVEDILARVPATSLKRLRSTCKQWNFLFNDQIFTKMHFDKAEKQFLVLILRLYTVCSMSLDLRGLHDNIDPSIEVKGELSLIDPHCSSRKTFVSKVFHCNGLLLCTTMTGLVVWNPCTDQTRWIKTEVPHNRNDKYALGYGNYKSCYNYKIMKFLDLESFDLEIYEVNSNSWRVLGTVTPDFTIPLDAEGVSLRGNSYWIASHKREEIEEEEEEENEYFINDFLISFDFTTERFGPRVSLPFKCESSWDTISLSCVREERLSLFFQDDGTLKMEIWMTNNITETKTTTMSWSPFLKIDLYTYGHRFGNEVSFLVDEENKVIVCCDEEEDDINDTVYIIGENEYWRKEDIVQRSYRPRMFSYVPSLVQI
ncbi:unnamed protein product [Arabidopsis thaliana]|uniref:Putative F-box/kelch-repeat protein At1g62270 n=2 Tax=Arabidopsis thaliana TaxID=3702 RepID=FBK26_ARATH|nr:F-box and associated interaction domains-containing protein [Arabidopsis thaliana]O04591.2 RecName: Full=Putative F-box/kelch-repeat protein At1g62270 [Arabidopsis thaliana]AEE33944.1 F-box and associated interaction domains-containing protein [Arabidopsis thaliana]CAA0309278.1 unnamed protein product [Arabidopsis thaliana]VYS49745.1 unnamed protein product [Arabidopsis thaliana]|eukprot:NP_176417.1 F-box and associated interaction domains-containing protein [Arabidopsis thaliana]